ncbi:MAG TPA: hypothetical protein VLX33_00400 [Nitrososphaerales archaeon]|nr:hypothetical protein [Nitrososphaerales archaeon]
MDGLAISVELHPLHFHSNDDVHDDHELVDHDFPLHHYDDIVFDHDKQVIDILQLLLHHDLEQIVDVYHFNINQDILHHFDIKQVFLHHIVVYVVHNLLHFDQIFDHDLNNDFHHNLDQDVNVNDLDLLDLVFKHLQVIELDHKQHNVHPVYYVLPAHNNDDIHPGRSSNLPAFGRGRVPVDRSRVLR